MITALGRAYLCEQTFPKVKSVKSCYRVSINRWTFVTKFWCRGPPTLQMLYLPAKPVLLRPVLPKIVASYLSSTIKICEILCLLLLRKYLHNILSLNYLLYGTWQKSLLTLLWRSACWWGEWVPGCRGSGVRPCQTLFLVQWGARYGLRH